ncbi:MAG: hypothetical protein KKC68_05165 [Candidatus Thermoplasmatota archaeon]|nr:hypothetical protein [Candidatus Thermoplasmatota archaeon]
MKGTIQLKYEFSKTSRSEKPKSRNGRILVMDDENIIRKIAGSMLMRLGYDPEVSK